MKKVSKRFNEIQKLVNNHLYNPKEGVKLLKQIATAGFNECAEVHFTLNLNTKFSDQQLRTTIVLPHGTGQEPKIALLLPEKKMKSEYRKLVHKSGSDDLIELISQNELDFDILISTPDMMPKLAKLGRILGPRNLMPSIKSGTITEDIETTIIEFKKGKIEYRSDKAGIVHSRFGKMSFSENQLLENLTQFYESITQNKPGGVKGKYFKSMHICTTMSPSVAINFSGFIQ
uniref:ribosomal protein L1 n=1 Tax=Haramonas pauciplastida TaxID=478668 RepID=UPI0021140BFA|nr:ribosomal protein L1 [Haramonas pauciplastida]UTE94922.1 ribosomal protein L1 [Haramonas pauciplastida]